MPSETHSLIASLIWSICNLLRGPCERNEYRKVILPLTVLRRFDCILAPTEAQVLKEQSNEEAGEHFTPREVIKLMVNLLFSPEKDLARSHVVTTICDPACGTGGMLSVAEKYSRDLNADAQPKLFGQDWNDETWAVCKSDTLIKGEDAGAIILGDTFTKDGFDRTAAVTGKIDVRAATVSG